MILSEFRNAVAILKSNCIYSLKIVHFIDLKFGDGSPADLWTMDTELVSAVAGSCGLPNLFVVEYFPSTKRSHV